jgi:hypothetical protein
MKKIIATFISSAIVIGGFGQEAADKKIQAGIVTGFGLNFTSPTTKLITRKGVGTDLTIGMNLNYNFTPTIGVNTGIEFDFQTFKYGVNPSDSLYYYYNDAEILSKGHYYSDNSFALPSSAKLYRLSERKEKPIYLTIPTMMLFRTKFIGYFRYFGKFGVRNSFLLGSTIFDAGKSLDETTMVGTDLENTQMKTVNRDMALYKGTVGMSGGLEWNFSGTTSLVAELGYYYGFLNISRGSALTGDNEKNMSVFKNLDTNGPSGYSSLPLKQNQLMLKVSILF